MTRATTTPVPPYRDMPSDSHGLSVPGLGQDSRSTIERADTPAQVTFDVTFSRKGPGQGVMDGDEDGMRGRTCTPASFTTEFTELKSLDDPYKMEDPHRWVIFQ